MESVLRYFAVNQGEGGRLKYGTLPVSGCFCGEQLIGYMTCLKRDQSDHFLSLLFPICLTQMSELELSRGL